MERQAIVDKKREWTGYKLATIVISIILVLVVFLQAVYNNYYTQRWKEIEYYESKISSKRQELTREKQIPKATLKVTTLEKIGLSKPMLMSLSALPSTISLEHAGGATVEEILLIIKSSEPILQFQEWESAEEFSLIYKNEEPNKLALKAQRLRKGAVIGVTISTKKPTEIKTELIIDKGEEFKAEDRRYTGVPDKIGFDLIYPSLWKGIRIKDIEELSKISLKGESSKITQIEKEIFILEKKIEQLKSESLWSWVLPKIVWPSLLLAPIFIILLAAYFFAIRPDLKKRSLCLQIISDIKNNKIAPQSLLDLFQQLGCPDDLKPIEKDGTQEVHLTYFSKYEFLKSNGIRFIVHDQSIIDILDDKNISILKR